MASCCGIKADGGRCGGQAIGGSQWCFSHHPDYEEQRRRRASKGGKRGGRGRPMAELSDIKRLINHLVAGVLKGTTDRADAAVCGQLLNTQIRAVGVELKAREQMELEARLEDLERLLESKKEGGRWGA